MAPRRRPTRSVQMAPRRAATGLAALLLAGRAANVRLRDDTGVATPVTLQVATAELQYLDLYSTAVSGDVAALATLGKLQHLGLGSTRVAGDVAALGTLGQLRDLKVDDTDVWGRADALRAIPGLGADWRYFTTCAASGNSYGTAPASARQCPAGRSPVADGASYLGRDECACCSGSLKMWDRRAAGACVEI